MFTTCFCNNLPWLLKIYLCKFITSSLPHIVNLVALQHIIKFKKIKPSLTIGAYEVVLTYFIFFCYFKFLGWPYPRERKSRTTERMSCATPATCQDRRTTNGTGTYRSRLTESSRRKPEKPHLPRELSVSRPGPCREVLDQC